MIKKPRSVNDPSGMKAAGENNILTVDELYAFLKETLPRIDPSITVILLQGKSIYVCGKKNPSFEIEVRSSKTNKAVFIHATSQGSTGNACERSHRYFSLRSDLLAEGERGCEYSYALIPSQGHIPAKHDYQLRRAAELNGSHKDLGYFCSSDRALITEYCVKIARFLNGETGASL